MGRKWVVVLLAAIILLPATVLAAASKEFRRTVPFEPGGRLSLETFKGSIELTSWDRREVEIVARIEADPESSADYGQRAVQATEIEVGGTSTSLRIKSDYSRLQDQRRGWSDDENESMPFVRYQIRAPRRADLHIEDFKSDSRLSGFEGRVEFKTFKGTLDGRDLNGELRLETFKGNAQVHNFRGQTNLETFKGEISLEMGQMSGSSRAETFKGTINLALPRDQPFTVDTDLGRKAEFASDFNLQRDMRDSGGRRRGERWTGTVNGGGTRLTLKSDGGSFRLKRQ